MDDDDDDDDDGFSLSFCTSMSYESYVLPYPQKYAKIEKFCCL